MLKIDSHQHFWTYEPIRDSWIDESMSILQDDFMPEHLQPILEHYGFQGSVVVQASQSPQENLFQLNNAESFPFIKGVIGWVDFLADDLNEQLESYQDFDKLKGFRHILQGEKNRAIMLSPKYSKGFELLNVSDYTYDVLVLPDQLKYLPELVKSFPNQRFVLDHLGKPNVRSQEISEWAKDIKSLAAFENVWCKVSGMVTEADLRNWKKEDFSPYLDIIFESFGAERVMFGSDWPVCRLAATYGQVLGIVEDYLAPYSATEKELFWGGNAAKFYNLSI
jgi:L-fuconolactonase